MRKPVQFSSDSEDETAEIEKETNSSEVNATTNVNSLPEAFQKNDQKQQQQQGSSDEGRITPTSSQEADDEEEKENLVRKMKGIEEAQLTPTRRSILKINNMQALTPNSRR